jgi:hypothetical protein
MPTPNPQQEPRRQPTPKPQEAPRRNPTPKPQEAPRRNPTPKPQEEPRRNPTPKPQEAPRRNPTPKPQEAPRRNPTPKPQEAPRRKPTWHNDWNGDNNNNDNNNNQEDEVGAGNSNNDNQGNEQNGIADRVSGDVSEGGDTFRSRIVGGTRRRTLSASSSSTTSSTVTAVNAFDGAKCGSAFAYCHRAFRGAALDENADATAAAIAAVALFPSSSSLCTVIDSPIDAVGAGAGRDLWGWSNLIDQLDDDGKDGGPVHCVLYAEAERDCDISTATPVGVLVVDATAPDPLVVKMLTVPASPSAALDSSNHHPTAWSLSSLDLYVGRDLLPRREGDGAVSTDPADYPIHASFAGSTFGSAPLAVNVDASHRDALRPGNFLMAHARVCRADGGGGAVSAAAAA